MKTIQLRWFDTRINTMYPHIKLWWNWSIEARLDSENPETVVDITIEHANWNHDDYIDNYIKISQSTGIKDKNWTMIFEWDIIKHVNVWADETPYKVPTMTPDSFEDLVWITDSEFDMWNNRYDNILIIGNQFENPELQKVE